MEKRFLIKWEIDEFAETPLEAIKKAIKAMPTDSNPDTMATIFDVEEIDINSNKVVATHQIDILELEEESGQDRESYTDDQDRKNYTV